MSLGQLVLTYVLGVLTLPALLIAGLVVLWALHPSAEPQLSVSTKFDTANSRQPPKGPAKPPYLSSPYGERRTGWLRITRSLSSLPPELADSHPKLADIVARGFTKWVNTRLSSTSSGSGAAGSKRSDSGASASGHPADSYQPDMYYVVLSGDTLVMYDGEAMSECRGVIIMPKHRVSLHHNEGAGEAQVYSRRTPIKLSPVDESVESGRYKRQVAEYYMYADRPTDKEDWYFALMWSSLSATAPVSSDDEEGSSNGEHTSTENSASIHSSGGTSTLQTTPTIPGTGAAFDQGSHNDKAFADAPKGQELTKEQRGRRRLRMRRMCLVPDSVGIDSILQTISMRNGSSANPGLVREDEWLNALFGRMFLGAYKTEWARRHLVRKMQAKFDRVHRPVFLDKIIVADLDIGDNVPLITSPKLEAFDTNGMVDISMYVHYMGGFRLVLNTGVKLGSLRMSVSLAVVLESLTGKMLVRLKPSPSNRFWMGFYEMPNIRLSLSPVLMQKKVKYAAVSQAIEKQIYDVLRQTLVLPNMDDTVFFPTFVDDGAILERSLKEYKDLVLGEDEIVLSSDDESEHSGTRRSASSRGKSSQPGSNHGSSHGSEIAPQRQSAQTTSPLDIPGESTNASAQMPSEGRPYSDDDVVWDGNNALSVQESTGSSRLSTASPKQLHDLQSKRSPSPARSISQQAKPASMKSTISLSAASFLKRARDSQAAESAKTWWQTIQQGGSNGGVAGKPPALPTKLVNASSPVIGGDGEGSSGSSDQKQPMPIHPLRPASGMSPRLPRYDELADDYELPLSTSPPSIPAGGSIAQINSTTASGDDSSGALQFPRLADSSVSSGYNSNYLNRGGKPAAPGTDSSLVRRRPAALSTGSDVELPLHSRYSKSNQHH